MLLLWTRCSPPSHTSRRVPRKDGRGARHAGHDFGALCRLAMERSGSCSRAACRRRRRRAGPGRCGVADRGAGGTGVGRRGRRARDRHTLAQLAAAGNRGTARASDAAVMVAELFGERIRAGRGDGAGVRRAFPDGYLGGAVQRRFRRRRFACAIATQVQTRGVAPRPASRCFAPVYGHAQPRPPRRVAGAAAGRHRTGGRVHRLRGTPAHSSRKE